MCSQSCTFCCFLSFLYLPLITTPVQNRCAQIWYYCSAYVGWGADVCLWLPSCHVKCFYPFVPMCMCDLNTGFSMLTQICTQHSRSVLSAEPLITIWLLLLWSCDPECTESAVCFTWALLIAVLLAHCCSNILFCMWTLNWLLRVYTYSKCLQEGLYSEFWYINGSDDTLFDKSEMLFEQCFVCFSLANTHNTDTLTAMKHTVHITYSANWVWRPPLFYFTQATPFNSTF